MSLLSPLCLLNALDSKYNYKFYSIIKSKLISLPRHMYGQIKQVSVFSFLNLYTRVSVQNSRWNQILLKANHTYIHVSKKHKSG